jgi:hypothetical protein
VSTANYLPKAIQIVKKGRLRLFSDTLVGLKMFEKNYGPKWGLRGWVAFFAIVIRHCHHCCLAHQYPER